MIRRGGGGVENAARCYDERYESRETARAYGRRAMNRRSGNFSYTRTNPLPTLRIAVLAVEAISCFKFICNFAVVSRSLQRLEAVFQAPTVAHRVLGIRRGGVVCVEQILNLLEMSTPVNMFAGTQLHRFDFSANDW